MLLKDKVILVTGASRGIGKAIAEKFVNEGGIVYANARSEGSLDNLPAGPGRLFPLYFDIRDAAARKEVFARIHKERKKLDVLVNNAGVMKDALIGMIPRNIVDEVFEANVFAMIELVQLAARIMKRNNGGSIINISSIVGARGAAGQLVYSASKGAVVALTKSAAKELGSAGIRVNAIAPGYIDTDMYRSVPEDRRKRVEQSVSLGRIGKPEDVANVALFLASSLSEYVSSQIIGVDGAAN